MARRPAGGSNPFLALITSPPWQPQISIVEQHIAQVIEALKKTKRPLTVNEIAARTGLNRFVAYSAIQAAKHQIERTGFIGKADLYQLRRR